MAVAVIVGIVEDVLVVEAQVATTTTMITIAVNAAATIAFLRGQALKVEEASQVAVHLPGLVIIKSRKVSWRKLRLCGALKL